MNRNISTFRSIVTRCLAVGVLFWIYCAGIVGASALVLAASTTAADARGGGGGGFRGGGFRGGGFRGRGFGLGWGGYAGPGCYFSYRWGRVICPGYGYGFY